MNETPLSLLERLRTAPDDPSWTRLAHLYEPFIRGWLRGQGLPGADADDLTQEILIVLHRDLGRFEHNGRVGAFRSWVRTIALHRLRGFLRSRAAMMEVPVSALLLDDVEDPNGALSLAWDREHDAEITGRLLALIEAEFAPATWAAFRRQVIDGATARDAASELGVSVNAVLIAKSRVLRRLRREASGLVEASGINSAPPVV